jgi:hypothetical protein
MSKLFSALLTDVLEHLKTPEAAAALEMYIVRPILKILYPYILGIMFLWVIMFVCVVLILLILVRGLAK